MIEAQELTGYISQDKVLTGELSKTIEVLKPITQEKEVIPTKETQIIEPDKDFTGLSKVTVQAIPNEYIVPSGEIEFTQNGTYDITDKASAKVNIKEKVLGTKTITSNGTYKAIDDNLDGYSEVEVATSSVDINEYFGDVGNYKVLSFDDTGFYVPTGSYNKICQNLTKLNGPIRITNTVNDGQSYSFAYMPMIEEFPDITYVIGRNFSYFFYADIKLKKIPVINSENGGLVSVTNLNSFCYGCKALIEVPLLRLDSATNIANMFNRCSSLTTLGGFQNLGKAYDTTSDENRNIYRLDLSYATSLTEQSIINVLTNLYDIATKGVKPQTVTLGSTNLAKLTSTEGQQALANAQAKGWNIN